MNLITRRTEVIQSQLYLQGELPVHNPIFLVQGNQTPFFSNINFASVACDHIHNSCVLHCLKV